VEWWSRSLEAPFPIITEDLATMINLMKVAEAEAISINGQRIVGSTAIVLNGSSTMVNLVPINHAEGIRLQIDD
jgi:uncharacterized protein YlxW (UPF0749 family)